jgi:hypothetical protein
MCQDDINTHTKKGDRSMCVQAKKIAASTVLQQHLRRALAKPGRTNVIRAPGRMTNRARMRMLAVLIRPIYTHLYAARRWSIIQVQSVVKMRLTQRNLLLKRLGALRLQPVMRRLLAQQDFTRRLAASRLQVSCQCRLRNVEYGKALLLASTWLHRIFFLRQRNKAFGLTGQLKRKLAQLAYARQLLKVRDLVRWWPRMRFCALRSAASRLHHHLKRAAVQWHYARQRAVVTLQTFISSSFKRQSLSSARGAASEIQRHLRMQVKMEGFGRQRAVVTLQTFHNTKMRRQSLLSARMAAIQIQRQLRRHAGMQECDAFARFCAMSVLHGCLRRSLSRRDYVHNRWSAHVLTASCHSGVLRRRYHKLLTEDRINIAGHELAAVLKKVVARIQYVRMLEASVLLQCALRFLLAKRSVKKLQRIANLVIEDRTIAQERERRKQSKAAANALAANAFAAVLAGLVARSRYLRMVEVSVTLQCALRFHLAKRCVRKWQNRRRDAALTVQCSMRVLIAKRRVNRTRREMIMERIVGASVKIQSVARGWFERRVVARKRKDVSNQRTCAAIIVQRAFRSCPRNTKKPILLTDDQQEIESGQSVVAPADMCCL